MEIDSGCKSVHEYMDALFRGKTPTQQEIQQAKLEYRKLYQQYYQETYKKNHVQITFRVSKEQYASLQISAKQRGVKTTKLAKQRVLKSGTSPTTNIKLQLSELIDFIEEIIYENKEVNLAHILNQLETIENKL